MILKIAGQTFDKYNEVAINLKYDSIADTFTFKLYNDPYDQRFRNVMKPGQYLPCTIEHGGVLVMTGTILSHGFESAGDPPRSLVDISGYSKTGILEDSCILLANPGEPVITPSNPTVKIPNTSYQLNGYKLQDIAERLMVWYDLKVVVDDELKSDTVFNNPYPVVNFKQDETVKEFLDKLCKEKHVVLSHDRYGNLLLTRAKVDTIKTTETTFVKDAPVEGEPAAYVESTAVTIKSRPVLFRFTGSQPWYKMKLRFNGQQMHRIVQVTGQADSGDGNNAIDSATLNPYVAANTYRLRREIQTTSTDPNETPKTARSIVGDELKALTLTIEMQGWTLGGNLVTPNQIIEVASNPELYLYGSSQWFIQEVMLYGNEKEERATLVCVQPAAFGTDDIINVFE